MRSVCLLLGKDGKAQFLKYKFDVPTPPLPVFFPQTPCSWCPLTCSSWQRNATVRAGVRIESFGGGVQMGCHTGKQARNVLKTARKKWSGLEPRKGPRHPAVPKILARLSEFSEARGVMGLGGMGCDGAGGHGVPFCVGGRWVYCPHSGQSLRFPTLS